MKKLFLVFLLLLSFPCVARAQATSTSKLAWDIAAPDLATVNSYTYKYYPDTATTGVTFMNVTCIAGTATFSCSVAFPAFTPGSHTLTITASDAAGESAKSVPFQFTFVVIPAVPTNIRIQ